MLIVPTADPDFGRILEEQARLEKLRAIRILLLTVLAVVGAFVWLAAIGPRPEHRTVELLALITWPPCFAWFLVVCALEHRTGRRLGTLLKRQDRSAA